MAVGHCIAGLLPVEYTDRIRALKAQPGALRAEQILQDMAAFGFGAGLGKQVKVIGETVHWLATSPDADWLRGRSVQWQEFCFRRRLVTGWTPKKR